MADYKATYKGITLGWYNTADEAETAIDEARAADAADDEAQAYADSMENHSPRCVW